MGDRVVWDIDEFEGIVTDVRFADGALNWVVYVRWDDGSNSQHYHDGPYLKVTGKRKRYAEKRCYVFARRQT